MKVLFAMGNALTSKTIADKYYEQYGEVLEYKDVFFFKSLLDTVKKDKTYDRIIISEDLEKTSATTIEAIDKFIFTNIDNITDELQDSDIIFICTDRRTKTDPLISRLFNIGIYNLLIGSDRSTTTLCDMIKNPRNKRQAKEYLNMNPATLNVSTSSSENEVDEGQLINIIKHYEKLGNDTEKYIPSFDRIVEQYTPVQLKIIATYLPEKVKNVIARDERYAYLFEPLTSHVNKSDEHRSVEKITATAKGLLGAIKSTFKVSKHSKGNQANETLSEVENSNAENSGFVSLEEEKESLATNQFDESELLKQQAQAREKSEREARERAEADAKARAERMAEAEARARALKNGGSFDSNRDLMWEQSEREEQARAEADARARAEREAEARAEAKARAERDARNRAQAEEEERIRREAETKARFENERQNKLEVKDVVNNVKEVVSDNIQEQIYVDIGNAIKNEVTNLADKENDVIAENVTFEQSVEEEVNVKLESEARQKAEEEARQKAEEEARFRAEDEARKRAEEEARLRAEAEAKKRAEEEARLRAEAEARKRAEEEARLRAEAEARKRAEEEARLRAEAEARIRAEEEARARAQAEASARAEQVMFDNNSNAAYQVPKDYKKYVAVVGANKSGTTFLVNAIANCVSQKGISTALLDMTKDRSLYYIYQDNYELRKIAMECFNNLSDGKSVPINVSKFLNVFTTVPGSVGDNRKNYRHRNVIETAKREHNLVIADCDFSTPIDYFEHANEIYIVQDLDILKLQETTMFLRELKNRNIDMTKIRIIINKYVKTVLTPKKIVEGLSYYNDPEMSFVDELLSKKVLYTIVPFEIQNYINYTEDIYKNKFSYKNYTYEFLQAIDKICMSVYPVNSAANKGKRKFFG